MIIPGQFGFNCPIVRTYYWPSGFGEEAWKVNYSNPKSKMAAYAGHSFNTVPYWKNIENKIFIKNYWAGWIHSVHEWSLKSTAIFSISIQPD
jgi:hypothetical protein